MPITIKTVISDKMKEAMKRAVKFNNEHPDLMDVAIGAMMLESRLNILLNQDPEYVKERDKLLMELKERYVQKYLDEGLL